MASPTPVILCLTGADYKDIEILIDANTIKWYGPTTGYNYPQSIDKEDCRLVVTPVEQDIDKLNILIASIKEAYRLNVDKDKYIKLYTKFEDYEKDKRARISLRLSSGAQGLKSPPEFWFKSAEGWTSAEDTKLEETLTNLKAIDNAITKTRLNTDATLALEQSLGAVNLLADRPNLDVMVITNALYRRGYILVPKEEIEKLSAIASASSGYQLQP